MAESPQRALPSADLVLRTTPVSEMLDQYDRDAVVRLVRLVLQEYRAAALEGKIPPPTGEIARVVQARAREEWTVAPSRIINATGIILHTNLGRAPLSADARAAMQAAAGYSDLELDLLEGGRGERQTRVRRQLTALTGADDAHVTVSAASAVLLALSAWARGRDVLVSRGQSVEIGGGFRVPVVLKQSGARLVEVGSTNRTRLSDYEEAFTPRTAAILHVHSSNFRIVGFTESVPLDQLAHLAHRIGVPLVDDNGSGALVNTEKYGLGHEPTVQESLRAGSDIVAFSGDKLLGGPQAGILLGRTEYVDRLRKHPLARAVRPDKTSLAALSATLLAYLHGSEEQTIPVWQMISAGAEDIERRAVRFRDSAAGHGLKIELAPGTSTVGGGSLPEATLPSMHLVLPRTVSAAKLRRTTPPIIALTREGRTRLDLRTVAQEEEQALLAGLVHSASRREAQGDADG